MSIKKFIQKVCVQDAIYWAYLGPDGMGGSEYESPAEIVVRWDEHTEVVSDSHGKEFLSSAQVLVPHDLKEQSLLMLGTLDQIPNVDDPNDAPGSFEIKKMDRHPLFMSKTLDVFMAYLG